MKRLVKLPGVTDAQREAFDRNGGINARNRLGILNALATRTCYQGTVPAKVKAERRARNKTAKASRRVNRGR